jgi:hypothetical protein
MDKGKVAFDGAKSDEELVGRTDLWMAVLKNVRAGLMPPEKKPKPSAAQVATLARWIKYDAFGIDPAEPDPGRVTVRRLNRVEYRNTIRDLLGHDYKVDDELPPDDTGYGFDNIGDVLTISPLLLEKYMQAAETIVSEAVPRVPRVVAERYLAGNSFRREAAPQFEPPPEETPKESDTGKGRSNDRDKDKDKDKDKEKDKDRISFYEGTILQRSLSVAQAGTYRLVLELQVFGEFVFDPGHCRVVLKDGDRPVIERPLGWQSNNRFTDQFEEAWTTGDRLLTVEVHPLVPVARKTNSLSLQVVGVKVQGPLEKEHWVRPKNFDLLFTQDPPKEPKARRDYARAVLERFAQRAFRRGVDTRTVDRLVGIAESTYATPGRRFEDGIAQAIVPVLASPRFLFRIEDVLTNAVASAPTGKIARDSQAAPAAGHPLVDEPSLAARLSYFLWSSMPDEELSRLAAQGGLRKNLDAQIRRLLADRRSREFVDNFVGQWLQVRDVEGIDINSRVILSRDAATDLALQRNRDRFQELRKIPDEKLTPEQQKELDDLRAQFRRRFGERPQVELDRDLRRALRLESEMYFSHLLREDRSVLELLDSDYTFLNERLARHYGLTNLNVTGGEMRRVALPPGSPRGGVLTHGSVLIVTSNPTRTSPVKRGLFILDNILGTPPPPPPANVPPLEDSEKPSDGRSPTLRETLAIHRENALCRSCHNRMDPLGLALENFNALGMWREKERGQPIDATGSLITGEPFRNVRDVKKILVQERHLDFYRCLTEKMLTYALGRGLTHLDVEAVDRIVDDLERQQGRLSALVRGVIESAPFQKRRDDAVINARGPGARRENPVASQVKL